VATVVVVVGATVVVGIEPTTVAAVAFEDVARMGVVVVVVEAPAEST
jgi:hypothetical protein